MDLHLWKLYIGVLTTLALVKAGITRHLLPIYESDFHAVIPINQFGNQKDIIFSEGKQLPRKHILQFEIDPLECNCPNQHVKALEDKEITGIFSLKFKNRYDQISKYPLKSNKIANDVRFAEKMTKNKNKEIQALDIDTIRYDTMIIPLLKTLGLSHNTETKLANAKYIVDDRSSTDLKRKQLSKNGNVGNRDGGNDFSIPNFRSMNYYVNTDTEDVTKEGKRNVFKRVEENKEHKNGSKIETKDATLSILNVSENASTFDQVSPMAKNNESNDTLNSYNKINIRCLLGGNFSINFNISDCFTTHPTSTTPTTTSEDPFISFCKEACLHGEGGIACNCANHPIGKRSINEKAYPKKSFKFGLIKRQPKR